LPPMAIFLAAIQLGYRERRSLSLIIIAIGVMSVFLGLSQVAQGSGSELRFYTITNNTEAVGFFANRNHFAALLYAVLLFAAVWAIDIGFKTGSWKDVRTFESANIMPVTAIFLVFVVVIAGEAMARSRAGLALTIVALVAVFALAFTDRRNTAGLKSNKLLIAAIVLAIILSLQFALYRVLGRFAYDPLENARLVFAHNTIRAAWAFMPFGSGLGTFVPVYAMFERPVDTIANTYANHAHDDILELWLETGVMGIILICLFLTWLGFASVKLWRRPPSGPGGFDCTLARAAALVIGLLVAHSFVDYPMRTEAIMAVFAVSCALLIEPLRSAEEPRGIADVPGASARRGAPPSRPARTAAPPSSASAPPAMPPAAPKPRLSGGQWGDGVEWPAEWRSSGEAKRPGWRDREADPNGDPDSDGKN
jgi:O-antigen ligase